MAPIKLEKRIRDQYENRLRSKGQQALYKHIIGQCIINKNINSEHPEIALLQHSEYFFAQYRSDGKEINFIIGKILRRAAHKLYREFRKMNSEFPTNGLFLNIIK